MRTSRILSLSFGFAVLALMLGAAAASAQTWSVTKTFPIGGDGSWDYLTVDAPSHRLFVPRSTHTQIIDEDSGKVLGDVPGQKGAHGVAVVPKLNRGFITDGGGSGAILVFDLKTYATLGSIKTMPDTDGIIYDAGQNRVLAVSGDGGTLMVFPPDIDPASGKVTSIDLGGKPEFLAADGAGKVYVNLVDKDLVAVVDLKASKVIARWPTAPGGSPVGMALDTATHTLVLGCRKPAMTVFMDAATGKVTSSFPIGPGVDATKIDGAQAFASSGDGTLAVASLNDGKLLQTVKTPAGARTMGVDTQTHRIFMPTAELEPATGGGRPRPKPGTFMIVVVERK
jgi:DNA-binding beta-propeller fold protein YncE